MAVAVRASACRCCGKSSEQPTEKVAKTQVCEGGPAIGSRRHARATRLNLGARSPAATERRSTGPLFPSRDRAMNLDPPDDELKRRATAAGKPAAASITCP